MTTAIFDWLATYFVHSSALLLLALAGDRWLRARPALASAVWKTALVAGVVTASLQVSGAVEPLGGRFYLAGAFSPEAATSSVAPEDPAPIVVELREEPRESSLAPAAPVVARALGDAPVVAETVSLALIADVDGSTAEQPPALDPVIASVSSSVASTPSAAPVAPVDGARGLDWRALLVGVWITGCLLGLLRVAWAWVRLIRRLRGRRTIRGGSIREIFERLCQTARVGDAVRLSCTHKIHVPLAAGVVRPEICVPRRVLRALGPASQESLLAHELAHVVRRDPTWQLLGAVLERALFFQPLNRIATRQISTYSEYLCDAWAAAHTREPLALAQCLTEVAGWAARERDRLPVPAMAGRTPSLLGARVQRLLHMTPDDAAATSRRPWSSTLVSAGMFTAVVLIAPGALGSDGVARGGVSDCGVAASPAPAPIAPELLLARLTAAELPEAHQVVPAVLSDRADEVTRAASDLATRSLADSTRALGAAGDRQRKRVERQLDRVSRKARKLAERAEARQRKVERKLDAAARKLEAMEGRGGGSRGEHHIVVDLHGLDDVERHVARAAIAGLEHIDLDLGDLGDLNFEIHLDDDCEGDCDCPKVHSARAQAHASRGRAPLVYRYTRDGDSVTILVEEDGRVQLIGPDGHRHQLDDHWKFDGGLTPEQRRELADVERRAREVERRAREIERSQRRAQREVERSVERRIEREGAALEREAREIERRVAAQSRAMARIAERMAQETDADRQRALARELARERASLDRARERAQRELLRDSQELQRQAERAGREAERVGREAARRALEEAERARREAERARDVARERGADWGREA
ncbi:MAG: hypothetical protein KC468_26740, partial [Myxococcales bacterium]|nr:hypothetical protein [Myxococcales bacterium]